MIVNRVSVIRSWSIVRRDALTHLHATLAWIFRWALAGALAASPAAATPLTAQVKGLPAGLSVLMSFDLACCQGNGVQFVPAGTVPLAETTITNSERVTFNAFSDRYAVLRLRKVQQARYLEAYSYRFNRRFNLAKMTERLLNAACCCGPRPEPFPRQVELAGGSRNTMLH